MTVKYRWINFGGVEPYVGAGVNYTHFFNVEEPAGMSIKYDDSFGPALQAGIDIPVKDHWFINLDARKIWIQSDVRVDVAGIGRIDAEVDIDPWVVALGVGYKF